MLTTLGTTPTILATHRHRPVFRARWITTRPAAGRPPARPTARRGRWLPASALDVGEIVPPPEVAPDPLRHLRPPEWTELSLCATMSTVESDPIFHGIEYREAPGALIAAANLAREICAACPVAAACLTYALENDERYGVWGGTSGRQRDKFRTRIAAGTTIPELVLEALAEPAAYTGPVQELTA